MATKTKTVVKTKTATKKAVTKKAEPKKVTVPKAIEKKVATAKKVVAKVIKKQIAEATETATLPKPPAKKVAKEIKIAENGAAYEVNYAKGTVKKVFNNLKELSALENHIKRSTAQSFEGYVRYLKDNMPDEQLTVKKNTFTIKGFRFTFTATGIECKDILQYGATVDFPEPPTPRMIKEFLEPQDAKRTFSPVEMREASERGALLKEKSKVAVDEVAAVEKPNTKENMMKLRDKALRLIGRVRRKETDPNRLIEEVPSMINFHRLKVNITLLLKKYTTRQIRWAKYVDGLEALLREENFEKRPEKAPKFVGLPLMTFKSIEERGDKLIVDGKEHKRGEWLTKYLLQVDKHHGIMPNLMKWLKGDLSYEAFIEKPYQKDPLVRYEPALLKDMTAEQSAMIEELYYELEEWLPTNFKFDASLKKGQFLYVYFEASATKDKGRVVSTDRGIIINYAGEDYPLFKSQKYVTTKK